MRMGPRVSACLVLYRNGDEALETLRCIAAAPEPVQLFVVDNDPGWKPPRKRPPRGKRHEQGAETGQAEGNPPAQEDAQTGAQPAAGAAGKPGAQPEQEALIDRIARAFPQAEIIETPRNLGYGRANNMVLQKLLSDYHLILNPDVTFDPALLTRMADWMDEHPDVTALTPRVFYPDGREQFLPKLEPTVRFLRGGRRYLRGEKLIRRAEVWAEKGERRREALQKTGLRARAAAFFERRKDSAMARRVMELPTRELLWAWLLKARGNQLQYWRKVYTLENDPPQEPTEVFFATGSFLFIRTKAFYRLKGFDERFFLYHEDSDLSRRILAMPALEDSYRDRRRAKPCGKIVYHPDFTVVHDWKRADKHHLIPWWHHVVSTFRYFWKWGLRW